MHSIKTLLWVGFLKGFYFYIPIITLYFLDAGVGLPEIVAAQLFYSIFAFASEIPTGLLADKYGQKMSVVVGYVMDGLNMLLLIFFPSATMLFLAYGLFGIANSFKSGSQEALLYEYIKKYNYKDSYQKTWGAFLSNELLGFVVASIISGWAIGRFDSASYVPLIAATLIAQILAGVLASTMENLPAEIREPEKGAGMLSLFKQSFNLIKNNKIVSTLTAVILLTLSGKYFVLAVYPPHFEAHGVDPFYLGAVLSFGALLNMILMRYVYLLEKRLQLQYIILLINGSMALGYFALAMTVHPVMLVGSYTFIQGLFSIQMPIISDYINENTPSHIRTTVLSTVSFAMEIGKMITRVIMPVLVGAVGIAGSLNIQGTYLLVGVAISFYLLVRCGCTHKIHGRSAS